MRMQVSLDPIYAPPEKRMQPNQPGKFDIYCVGMHAMLTYAVVS